MSTDILNCFVCASDDGAFLGIFEEGKKYCQNIETCLSLKVLKSKYSAAKLCHKCVYELDQCSKFVDNYKKTIQRGKGNLFNQRGCCSLCMQTGKKGRIFNVWAGNPLHSCKEKLQKLFDGKLFDDVEDLLICLNCRYNLDVLFDLQYVFEKTHSTIQNISNGQPDLSHLKMMETEVINRKTTLRRRPTLSQSSETSETDSINTLSGMVPSKKRSKTTVRRCDACNAKLDIGVSMYRYHNSGRIVCHDCWQSAGPIGETRARRFGRFTTNDASSSSPETKLCSVFLKDILTFPEDEKNQETKVANSRNLTRYAVQQENGQKIYVILDGSSDESQSNSKPLKNLRKRKGPIDEESKLLKQTKMNDTVIPEKRTLRAKSVQSYASTSKIITTKPNSEDTEKRAVKRKTNRPKVSSAISLKIKRTKITESAVKAQSVNNKPAPKGFRKKSQSLSSSEGSFEPVKTLDLSEKSESVSDGNDHYSCETCGSDFYNRIDLLTHELTHLKKPSILLKKVNVSDVYTDDSANDKMKASASADDQSTSNGNELPVTNLNDSESSTDKDDNDCSEKAIGIPAAEKCAIVESTVSVQEVEVANMSTEHQDESEIVVDGDETQNPNNNKNEESTKNDVDCEKSTNMDHDEEPKNHQPETDNNSDNEIPINPTVSEEDEVLTDEKEELQNNKEDSAKPSEEKDEASLITNNPPESNKISSVESSQKSDKEKLSPTPEEYPEFELLNSNDQNTASKITQEPAAENLQLDSDLGVEAEENVNNSTNKILEIADEIVQPHEKQTKIIQKFNEVDQDDVKSPGNSSSDNVITSEEQKDKQLS